MISSRDPDRPNAWLSRAKSNLKLAETGKHRDIFLEDLCFQAQQAAEKALKAICIFHKLEFPKTHSLVALTGLLEAAIVEVPLDVKEADFLTSYAVQARYPGWDEPVTEEEYTRALMAARRVVTWAESKIQER